MSHKNNTIQQIFDDASYLIRKAVNNSNNFLYEFDEFLNGRNFETLKITNPNLYENLIKVYNQYILGNGIFMKKYMRFTLSEHQSFCFNILTRNPQKYKNHWYTYISNYIFSKYDEDISSIKLEDLKYITDYYSDGLSRKVKKFITEPPTVDRELNNKVKYMLELIQLGECIQYNVKGFYNNEVLYLLCGMAINEGIKREFNTFYSLFEFVKSYLQLWQFNKVFDSAAFDRENHNLVTHIKCNGSYVKRYRKCLKYFENKPYNKSTAKTKFIINEPEDKIYIETKYNSTELNEIWENLEQLYKDNNYIDLYYIYVTSQLLTRSSCLSALIILNILYYKSNKKFIKVKDNHQLDWYAISVDIDEFRDTYQNYTTEVELKEIDVNITKVRDVLNYIHYYIGSHLAK